MRCTMLLLLTPISATWYGYQTTPSYRLPKVINLPHICLHISISAIILNDNVDYVNVIHMFAEDAHAVYK